MLRMTLDKELQRLKGEVLSLGNEVQHNINRSVEALRFHDHETSQELVATDRQINRRRIEVGMDCLTLIATQQPLARDMRTLATVIEIVGELERIHDYVKGIARINLMLEEVSVSSSLGALLEQMAAEASDMLYRALTAFSESNAIEAMTIPNGDDQVDALYQQAYREVVGYIVQNPSVMEHANYLEWAAHNLERCADRVINICEWTVYMATGKFQELGQDA